MRPLVSTIVCLTFIGAAAAFAPTKAFSQDASSELNEIEQWRQSVGQGKNAAPAAKTAAPAEEEIINPMAAMNNDPMMSNPLGPAGTLPVGPMVGTSPAEMQALMEQEAADQRRKLEEQAFDTALKQLLPLEPEQIRKTLEVFKVKREAAETPITVPEPRQVVETLSLDPSEAPVLVKTAPGHVTTFTILDSTGAPWPIQDISWAGKFDVTTPEPGGHVVRITPMTAHGIGNISIRLVDLITPVTVRLTTGIDEVHYRFDARIPRPGPLAKTPLIQYGGLKAVAGRDDNMTGFLDGTPPKEAVRLKVTGADGRTTAWKVSEQMYLRTPLTLLSPGWDSSVSSADGMNVYALNQAPVILLSDEGRMVRAQIVADEVTTP
ncbi:MAG TPA: DotH/IcmK family type IV secretion protein [Alphaproteobacteria bacterium]|nr:DotH/IcmK family type IV secretion protein [Alphaproteobacteria bacterium]